MADPEGLLERYRQLTSRLLSLAREGNRILIVTHIDADGLCSGSIVFAALMRKRANVTVRALPDLDPKAISDVAGQGYDFIIFTDLGSSLVQELDRALGARHVIIDHHQLSAEDSGVNVLSVALM